MSNILHLLSSTFPTCACSAHERDCALRQMEQFVDGFPFEDSRPPGQGDHDGRGGLYPSLGYAYRTQEEEEEGEHEWGRRRRVDLGPLVGAHRGFRTQERVKGSGEMCGVVMWDYDGDRNEDRGEGSSTPPVDRRHLSARGDADAEMVDAEETEDELKFQSNARAPTTTRSWAHRPPQDRNLGVDDKHRRQHRHQHQQAEEQELRPPDPASVLGPETEEKMPPKMRKRWIHWEVEVWREAFVEMVGTAVETGDEMWGWVDRHGKEGQEGDVVMEGGLILLLARFGVRARELM